MNFERHRPKPPLRLSPNYSRHPTESEPAKKLRFRWFQSDGWLQCDGSCVRRRWLVAVRPVVEESETETGREEGGGGGVGF
ncbi:unnamed protein product [Prunus armeniaca]|uniref:Uncharacterized protein n=1 Tax=Prunus armeniaca TaxID=36596 RepID=A0A6J5VXY9_PRUAR|nr:unnamed protein product [Prunus armeniaca]